MNAQRCPVAIAAVCAAILLPCRPAAAQSAKNPIIGNWLLDVGKSTFPGARPEKRVMTFQPVPNGLKQSIMTTTSGVASLTYHLEYTAKFDGKDYPADAASAFDTVSLKRVDDRTVERIGKVKGNVVETETYKVSPDGKVLTVTQQTTNGGAPATATQVFERE